MSQLKVFVYPVDIKPNIKKGMMIKTSEAAARGLIRKGKLKEATAEQAKQHEEEIKKKASEVAGKKKSADKATLDKLAERKRKDKEAQEKNDAKRVQPKGSTNADDAKTGDGGDEKPLIKRTNEEIESYAVEKGIDLGDTKKKAEMVKLIEEELARRASEGDGGSDDETVDHEVTEEDLEENPDWVEAGYNVGDVIQVQKPTDEDDE